MTKHDVKIYLEYLINALHNNSLKYYVYVWHSNPTTTSFTGTFSFNFLKNHAEAYFSAPPCRKINACMHRYRRIRGWWWLWACGAWRSTDCCQLIFRYRVLNSRRVTYGAGTRRNVTPTALSTACVVRWYCSPPRTALLGRACCSRMKAIRGSFKCRFMTFHTVDGRDARRHRASRLSKSISRCCFIMHYFVLICPKLVDF